MLAFAKRAEDTKQKKKDDPLVVKLGKLLLGNTAKLANTAAGGVAEVGDLAKAITGRATGNKVAEKNALNANSGNQFLNEGKGLFGEGGFVKSAEEAGNMSAADVAKKSLGGGLGVASEIVPVGRGFNAASKGGKFVKALSEGAVTGAAGNTGEQLSNTGKIDPAEALKAALIGGAMGGAGFGVERGAQSASKTAKALAKDQRGSVKIPGTKDQNQAFDDLEAQGGKQISQESRVEPNSSPSRLNMVERNVQNSKVDSTASMTAKPDIMNPKTGAEVAQGALPSKISSKLDKDVIDLLGKTGKDKDAAAKAPVFEGARDPASVLGRHLGSVGTDIVNDSAQSFKRRSDLQENARPLIDDAQKKLKKAAKTDVGRKDLEARINNALEDRDNADSYFKDDKEKSVYDATKKFYDYYQAELERAGKGTLENYSPRVARRDAAHAADNLDFTVNKAFSTKADAPFLKQRTKDDSEIENLDSPVSIMNNYSSSVSKQLGYEDMLAKLPDKLKSVNPLYTMDNNTKQSANKYLQKYLQDQLQPDVPTSGKGLGKLVSEKTQNQLIANTYSAALKFNPKYYITNRTQGFATKSQTSRQAVKLAKQMKDDPEWKKIQGQISSGDATVSGDITGKMKPQGKVAKADARLSGEKRNLTNAFDAGVAENIIRSKEYKGYVQSGMKPVDAAKATLRDENFNKDLASRHGNVVSNTTQFGANIATKPGWLRDSGTMFGLSKKWYQQYQRFPLGMMQMLGNITDPKAARAIDIMRRGDPAQTKLVDYSKAVKVLKNAIPEAEKAVKAGESTVSPQQLAQSKKLLNQMSKELDKQIKANSSIRAGKTAKSVAKMWASASVIQYLFSNVLASDNKKQSVGKVIENAAPINVPSKDQNPLIGARIPSSPFNTHGVDTKKILNFVPVVGPAVNRGRDVANFIGALTGNE